jgi:hypothetical protein
MCELGFQNMADPDTADAAAKQMVEEEGEAEGQSIECVSHGTALQCVDTARLHGSEGFKYCDITATRKIFSAMKRRI